MATSSAPQSEIHSPVTVPWIPIAWFGALLIALFATILYGMASEWFTDDDMGHGLFVPALACYIAWLDRDRLLATKLRPSWLGLLLVVAGFLALVGGVRGADFFISRFGFMLSLCGVIWTLAGFSMLKQLAFPLFILLFMIRIPAFLYSQITFPLQIFASSLAEHSLTFLGIPVLRDGNVLELASQRLSVVEACSGIRSLMSLSLMSLVYGHFFDNKRWMRWVLLIASVPIAISANAMRITLTGLLSEIQKEFAEGFYHSLEGWVIFVVALVCLLFTHQFINFVYRRLRPAAASSPSATVTA
jgi:exosortase